MGDHCDIRLVKAGQICSRIQMLIVQKLFFSENQAQYCSSISPPAPRKVVSQATDRRDL